MTTPVGVSATSHVNASSQRSNTTLMRICVSINYLNIFIEKEIGMKKCSKNCSKKDIFSVLDASFFTFWD